MSGEIVEVIAVIAGMSSIVVLSLLPHLMIRAFILNVIASLGFGYIGYKGGHVGVVIAQACYGLFSIVGIIKQLRKGDH